jgi:hypothetical protein
MIKSYKKESETSALKSKDGVVKRLKEIFHDEYEYNQGISFREFLYKLRNRNVHRIPSELILKLFLEVTNNGHGVIYLHGLGEKLDWTRVDKIVDNYFKDINSLVEDCSKNQINSIDDDYIEERIYEDNYWPLGSMTKVDCDATDYEKSYDWEVLSDK